MCSSQMIYTFWKWTICPTFLCMSFKKRGKTYMFIKKGGRRYMPMKTMGRWYMPIKIKERRYNRCNQNLQVREDRQIPWPKQKMNWQTTVYLHYLNKHAMFFCTFFNGIKIHFLRKMLYILIDKNQTTIQTFEM